MKPMSPFDAMMLLGESREHPMHIACLQLFEPPAGAGPEYPAKSYEAMVNQTNIDSTFTKHPAFFGGVTNVAWKFDENVELDYHLRRSALPEPGNFEDLLDLSSRWHGSLLDRHRPLWEIHLVEGLKDGRYAVYAKFHHALMDGVSALKLMQRTLTTDPTDTEMRAPWALGPGETRQDPGHSSLLRNIAGAVGATAGLVPSSLNLVRSALLEQQLMSPFGTPRSMFNVRIGGARSAAAQSWPLERIKRVKTAAGVTVNDVVLAMSAGALRAYMIEQDALPKSPLTAMVPVSLRKAGDGDEGGNMVGLLLCILATDVEDPAKRLEVISKAMRDGKQAYSQLSLVHQLALSAATMSGMLLTSVPGYLSVAPPLSNVVISNVPGNREPVYWNGARLDGCYPLSAVSDGQALNITLATNADTLDFGLVGCRRSVPNLRRMLLHLETALQELESAAGV